MNKSGRIVVMHGEIAADAGPDEQDVLEVTAEVVKACRHLGYETRTLDFSLNIEASMQRIETAAPQLVFNLVESVGGHNRLQHFAPALFELLDLPFTGNSQNAIYLTTNKVLAKQLMALHKIPTPAWQSVHDILVHGVKIPAPIIVKPWGEDASQGIDDHSVCPDQHSCLALCKRMHPSQQASCFAESFVDGREFNLSLLANGPHTVEIMPPAEILFVDFPATKPAIVNYKAKWEPDSFEYVNTPRTFEFSPHDQPVLDELHELARTCWKVFGLQGYARVDFRVDRRGRPFVIEINANPCIQCEGGFASACGQGGLNHEAFVGRIIEDALQRAHPVNRGNHGH